MDDLGPFRTILSDMRNILAYDLAQGDFRPFSIAVDRFTIALMELQLKNSPQFVLSFNQQKGSGYAPAQLWYKHLNEKAIAALDPAVRDPGKFRRKTEEYMAHALWMKLNVLEATRHYTDHEVITIRERQETKEVVAAIADALLASAQHHRYDPDFLEVSVEQALRRLLREERFDLMVALRIATRVPGDVSVMALPKPAQRPALLAAISFAIACIPLVGNAVSAYEVLVGQDIFGYPISDVERGIMAACILLPAVTRYVDEGRALYSAGRLATMHGGDVRLWSGTLAVSERLSLDANAIARLRSAQRTIAAGQRLTPAAAGDMADLLKTIRVAKADMGVPTVLSQRSTDAFEQLIRHNGRWRELDPNAIERIFRKKVESHIQGQLFEEIGENRFVLWLRDPSGKAALGLEKHAGRLDFIPGHQILDENGRQLTDGMIVRWLSGDELLIVAICEFKSSARAAEGLSFLRKSISKLNSTEGTLLWDAAERRLRLLQERARLTGTPVTKTRLDLMKEILKESQVPGGQILKDIRRFSQQDANGVVNIFVGHQPTKVHFSAPDTKFFGIMPSDAVSKKMVTWNATKRELKRTPIRVETLSTQITRELKEAGVNNFTILGMGFTQEELKSGAQVVKTFLGIK